MAIVGGLDLHRKQITFDVLDTVSGAVCAGAGSAPADRQLFRCWLAGFDRPAGGSGGGGMHRLAVRESRSVRPRVCMRILPNRPDVAGLRGPAAARQNDRLDARHLRELL